MSKKFVMDKGYDKELADAVRRGKELENQKKSSTKKTVKRK